MEKHKVHEIAVIMDGGEIEYLKFGEETVELKPLKGRQIYEYIKIMNKMIGVAYKEFENRIDKKVYNRWQEAMKKGKDLSKSDMNAVNDTMQVLFSELMLDDAIFPDVEKFVCIHVGKDLDWWKDYIVPTETGSIFFDIMFEQNNMEEFFPFYLKNTLARIQKNLTKKSSTIGATTKN